MSCFHTVLGEGAEDNTRGRVCSPLLVTAPRIDFTHPDAWEYRFASALLSATSATLRFVSEIC